MGDFTITEELKRAFQEKNIEKSNEYRRLDLSKIAFTNQDISMDTALTDITPIKFISKIEFTKAEKDYGNKRVKLEYT